MEYKYQTAEMDALMHDLKWLGTFSQDFIDDILLVWASRNIEEMIERLRRALASNTFLTEGFKNTIFIALESVVRERKSRGVDTTGEGKPCKGCGGKED